MSTPAGICKARLLSDPTGQTACDRPATSVDGRLCAIHSRQCQGLYRGYKRRNAQLDALAESVPPFLANTKIALVNQTFQDVTEKDILNDLFKYMFRKYNLLEKVIRGRKLHHSHFFAIDNDYGHEKYLTQLQNEKHIVARALERLGKRSAQVLYKQKKWLDWVQECQDDEETHRENESRKVKLEAQLFKRHQKEVEQRQRELKAKEKRKFEDAFLEETYTQRLSEMSEEAQDAWDPIQDVVEDERENYVDLIKHFLLIKDYEESASMEDSAEDTSGGARADTAPSTAMSKSAKKRAKKARTADTPNGAVSDSNARGPDTIDMETKAQIGKRLQEGVEYSRKTGYHVVGALETPVELYEKAAAIPDDEIETLLEEIAEVKMLLFCRLLLSHASLLPVALAANSVEEFLGHAEVTGESLRDLCLKIERPALQDVRDACADFVRAKAGEDELDEDDDEEEEEEDEDEEYDDDESIPEKWKMTFIHPDKSMPKVFSTKREQKVRKQRRQKQKLMGTDPREEAVDFGAEVEDEKNHNKKIRIKVCGRYISNYPSEKALSRGGWYHFCLIAKDSDLHDAIELCRNWNEFFELNTLCVYHYFPAAKWMVWVGDYERLQLLRMGFIPYFQSDRADLLAIRQQTGSRGMERRAHHIREARNFICGHIKRNDAASRRLIQYLSMMTFELIILVRDAKTGRILVKPPKEERWLVREKMGWGRASRNEYKDIVSVGPEFFEAMDKQRKWHFNFDDHYDLYIWDASGNGRPFHFLYERVLEVLIKAHRVREPKGIYNVVGPIIKTLSRDPVTSRTRTIEPGEKAESLWDQINGPEAKFTFANSRKSEGSEHFDALKYNEADELEDKILFPEEDDEYSTNLFKPYQNEMAKFEEGNLGDLRRFAYDLDSDEDISDDDEEDWDDYDSELDEPRFGQDHKMSEIPSEEDDEVFMSEYKERAERANRREKEKKHNPEEAQKAWDEFSNMFKDRLMLGPGSRQNFVLDYFNDPSRPLDLSLIPEDMRKSDEDIMGLMRTSLVKGRNYKDPVHSIMKADFDRYVDRQKAKVFKQTFHQADLTPNARRQHGMLTMMTRRMDDYQMSKLTLGPFELIASMGLVEKTTIDKRIVDDAFLAYAAVSLFYEGDDLLESKFGAIFYLSLFQDSPSTHAKLLIDQAERAKHLPDRRTNQSNKMMPDDLWKDWDRICKENKRAMTDGMIEHFYPPEWDKVVRPKIARLYKAGMICNTYALETAGIAIAAAEPGRDLDLYFDYRLALEDVRQMSHLQDPRQFTRTKFLETARSFAQKHPKAKFAALRIWSSDQFYPLMLGYWNRPNTSFLDSKGRGWEWKFIPKDMPFSEWSIHEQARLRIKPYADFFGDQVIVATDMYLVMGRDEKELRQLAAGVTFAVQTEPWRMEIDFWRSFVNVDLAFLEGIEGEWLETCKGGLGVLDHQLSRR